MRSSPLRVIAGVVVLAGIVLLAFYWLQPTKIGDIVQSPRDFDGKSVTVSGTVKDRMSLVLVKYFTLQDASGAIKVISKKPLPLVGSQLKVRGKVNQAFSIGDLQVVVLIEDSD